MEDSTRPARLATSSRRDGPRLDDCSPRTQASWKRALAEAIRAPDELVATLGLPSSCLDAARRAARLFPLIAPREFVARMRPGDPSDPLLRQVLPLDAEAAPAPGFTADPVGDEAARRAPGLLQKYHGRALLLAAGSCAVHCRYCFRRHFDYDSVPRGLTALEPALERLAADESSREVILSGGDPLVLTDASLEALVARLEAMPHLRRLRVHTRLPIVIPQRVDDRLLGWLRGTRLTPIVVVHANHPHELDAACCTAIGRLVDAGVPVLNQAVLLRGVNDDVETLEDLCERLVDARVMPYYLHQLDPVAGAAHFRVEVDEGRRLIAALRQRLPGHAVPRYVREIPGALEKTSLE